MADTIFKLNNVDYSSHVVSENYNVNYDDIYQEWTDGAQVKHRDIVGQKLRGTFEMYFESATTLQLFLTALSSAKTNMNTYPVHLKANNNAVDTLVSKNVFFDFKPVRKRDVKLADVFEIFEVTIEEP